MNRRIDGCTRAARCGDGWGAEVGGQCSDDLHKIAVSQTGSASTTSSSIAPYKSLIVERVQQDQQRMLAIPGNIKLRFFPSIGAQFGAVSLSEHGSGETFASRWNHLLLPERCLRFGCRLNVAASRAKCLAIVIANPALIAIECRTPEQMALVNTLCWMAEAST